jgi:hypothetical protein
MNLVQCRTSKTPFRAMLITSGSARKTTCHGLKCALAYCTRREILEVCILPLSTELGRRQNPCYTFNYSFILCHMINVIVLIVFALSTSLRKLPKCSWHAVIVFDLTILYLKMYSRAVKFGPRSSDASYTYLELNFSPHVVYCPPEVGCTTLQCSCSTKDG